MSEATVHRDFQFELTVSVLQANRIIEALRSSKGDRPASAEDVKLANRVALELDVAYRWHETREAAKQAEREARERRAANHELTAREAEMLLAILEGQGPFCRLSTGNTLTVYGRWHSVGHMGGAVRRLRDRLEEEGLIATGKISQAGHERLNAYIAAHPRFGKAVS